MQTLLLHFPRIRKKCRSDSDAHGTGAPRRPEHTSYLLIYAPRREVLEIWPARSSNVLRTFNCGGNSSLMSAPGVRKDGGENVYAESGKRWQDCFVLNGTSGQLFSVAARLRR